MIYPVFLAQLALALSLSSHGAVPPQAASAAKNEVAISELPGEIPVVISDRTPIGGAFIAGIVVGPLIGGIDFSQIRFYLPDIQRSTQFCVAAETRDGALAAPAKRWMLGPGLKAVRPKFQPSLTAGQSIARYSAADLAVRAQIGADCDIKPDTPYVPAAYGSAREVLTVMVLNGELRGLSAQLTDTNGRQATATCASDERVVSRKFNWVCIVPLRGLHLAGTSKLKLMMRDGLGKPQSESRDVVWP